jgi:hypothetical protein
MTVDTDVYFEVLAKVRVPSSTRPFGLGFGLIAHNSASLTEEKKGVKKPIEPGKVRLDLTRTCKSVPVHTETQLSFHISVPQERHSEFPDDFIAPTPAVPAFLMMCRYLTQLFTPFTGCFAKWAPQYADLLLFRDLSTNDRAFDAFLDAWRKRKDISEFLALVRIFAPSAAAMSKSGKYSLLEDADSDDLAADRVAVELRDTRELLPGERFRPFHTDELKRPIVRQKTIFSQ